MTNTASITLANCAWTSSCITESNYLHEFLHLITELTESIKSLGLNCKFMGLSILADSCFKLISNYHEEPWKFQSIVPGHFDDEYRKICP